LAISEIASFDMGSNAMTYRGSAHVTPRTASSPLEWNACSSCAS
jgi:hypothetical protein